MKKILPMVLITAMLLTGCLPKKDTGYIRSVTGEGEDARVIFTNSDTGEVFSEAEDQDAANAVAASYAAGLLGIEPLVSKVEVTGLAPSEEGYIRLGFPEGAQDMEDYITDPDRTYPISISAEFEIEEDDIKSISLSDIESIESANNLEFYELYIHSKDKYLRLDIEPGMLEHNRLGLIYYEMETIPRDDLYIRTRTYQRNETDSGIEEIYPELTITDTDTGFTFTSEEGFYLMSDEPRGDITLTQDGSTVTLTWIRSEDGRYAASDERGYVYFFIGEGELSL
ncbi:MAG: hypothetical protein K5745_00575 [Saccharofermentans sp.]|nr:hypothetical protein [Saccharofermentans sp.]